MTDVLTEDEVDLLLKSVSPREAEPGTHESHHHDDRHDLFHYDFRRPERVSKEQLKGLQSLFEAFARELSIALPPFLRAVVRVDLVSIDQLTYDEFILSVARPTALSIINMAPLEGNALIELSPSIVFPIVDRILGGKGASLAKTRELTEIENRIVHRLMLMILDSLRRSWEQLIEFKLTVVHQESDPLIVQIVAGSEMVILVAYEVHIGETVGSMNMCIPLMVLNPVLDQISQQSRYTRRMSPDMVERTRAQIERSLKKAHAPLDAILGRLQVSIGDILRLQVGDVIQLDSDSKAPLPVEVGSIPRFKAYCGRRGEQSAVQIVDLITDD